MVAVDRARALPGAKRRPRILCGQILRGLLALRSRGVAAAEELLVYGTLEPTTPQGKPRGNFPDISPYVQKLVTFLRMAKVPYTYVSQTSDHKAKRPKGKIPFIEHRGQPPLGDTAFIIDYLKGDPELGARCHGLDEGLSPEQHAVGHALRVMLEEKLFWGIPYFRWLTKEGSSACEEHAVFGPRLQQAREEGGDAEKNLRSNFNLILHHGPGFERHSYEEVVTLVTQDLAALDALMAHHAGPGPFHFGGLPSSYDAAVFGQISAYLIEPVYGKRVPFFQRARREFPRLVKYCEHIAGTYFPEQAGEIL